MKYWVFMCLTVGLVLGDEVIAWVCLLLATIPPFFRFAFAWAREMQKDDRKYGGYIDEDGFYN